MRSCHSKYDLMISISRRLSQEIVKYHPKIVKYPLIPCYSNCGPWISKIIITGSLLDLHNLTSILDLLNLNLPFNKIPRGFMCSLKFDHGLLNLSQGDFQSTEYWGQGIMGRRIHVSYRSSHKTSSDVSQNFHFHLQ